MNILDAKIHEIARRKTISDEISHTLRASVIYLDFVPGQVPTVSQDVAWTCCNSYRGIDSKLGIQTIPAEIPNGRLKS